MEKYDVFISHAHADKEWVHVLAENLRNCGLEVFLDAWEIAEGDVLVHELDRGLRDSLHGVLVVSPASMTRPWVRQEYAVLLQKAVERGRRLIPVVLQDAEMPPMLAGRLWIDFRGADGPLYEEQVRRLARALKDEKPGSPPRTSGIKPPPGTGYRAAGPIHARLVIDRQRSTFHGSGDPVSADVPGIDHGTEERLWKLFDAFERRPREEVRRDDDAPGRVAEPLLYRRQMEAGQALGRAFLPGPVSAALRSALEDAERNGATLELGLEIADERLADLPWETLRTPEADGPPLALHPNVHLYRAVGGIGAAVTWSIPGPLRILVAIGSPEAQNDRGELLDMEAELERILDAVEPARRQGKAWVRVLERGTLAAIRSALEAERYHVLHVSCHAGPGVLILEDEDGRQDKVTTERLCKEAISPGRGVPLVVLAGCSTARGGKTKEGDEERLKPGLARGLLEHGVPAVLAMQASVGDKYATLLGGALYGALATMERPEPLRALSRARQIVELERGESANPAEIAEWSVPVLFLRTPERGTTEVDLPLYDPSVPFEEIEQAEEVRLARGVVVRRVGEFVGRRRDQRHLLRILREPDSAGAVIRGLGGVGKSTLAAEVVQTLARDGWIVVSRFGEVSPEGILEEAGTTLFSIAIAHELDEKHPLRQVANVLRQPNLEWPDRLRILSDHVLGAMSVLLLLDNFEDNLSVDDGTAAFKNEQLAGFLGSWLAQPRKGRLLVTCRYPVPWPEDGGQAVDWHLGPLSLAETRKLIWRLPGLDALEPGEQQRAYADVGGHPRALEYLDALLRGGEARFRDVAQRMEKQLASRGIEEPREWMKEQGGELDRALAEAVTLAVDDVLLGQLLEGLTAVPMASRLVLGASVYRVPVEEVALRWQVGEIPELPEEDAEAFPEVAEPAGFAEAREALERSGLLAPFLGSDEGDRRYSVHRWTAGALAKRAAPDELTEAHRRAACYWRWRAGTVSRALEDYLEARYLHWLAGELDAAVLVTEWVCLQLETWGAYRREEQLLLEGLSWLPEGVEKTAEFMGQLANLAYRVGDLENAKQRYLAVIPLFEQAQNAKGLSITFHQMGMVAQARGSYDEALDS